MKSQSNRLSILSKKEIQNIYGLPNFSHEERIKYFLLNISERNGPSLYRLLPAKIHFILQLGYFKARKMFFNVSLDEAQDDVQFILQNYFPGIYDFGLELAKLLRSAKL